MITRKERGDEIVYNNSHNTTKESIESYTFQKLKTKKKENRDIFKKLFSLNYFKKDFENRCHCLETSKRLFFLYPCNSHIYRHPVQMGGTNLG